MIWPDFAFHFKPKFWTPFDAIYSVSNAICRTVTVTFTPSWHMCSLLLTTYRSARLLINLTRLFCKKKSSNFFAFVLFRYSIALSTGTFRCGRCLVTNRLDSARQSAPNCPWKSLDASFFHLTSFSISRPLLHLVTHLNFALFFFFIWLHFSALVHLAFIFRFDSSLLCFRHHFWSKNF